EWQSGFQHFLWDPGRGKGPEHGSRPANPWDPGNQEKNLPVLCTKKRCGHRLHARDSDCHAVLRVSAAFISRRTRGLARRRSLGAPIVRSLADNPATTRSSKSLELRNIARLRSVPS